MSRYERVARVTPESLWLTIKIEQALGNHERAMGFGDMLVRMYPEHPNTLDYISKRAKKPDATPAVAKVERVLKPQQSEMVEEPAPQPQVATPPEPVVEQPEAAVEQEVAQADEIATEELDSVAHENTAEVFHVVQKDENLYRISLRYNLKMQRLIDWNNLADASAIYAGMKLYIVDPQTIE